MLGLETALSVVALAMVETGLLDWAGVCDRMSARPARIGRLAGQGQPIAVGAPANVVLIDPAARRIVDPRVDVQSSRASRLLEHTGVNEATGIAELIRA